MSDHTFKPFDKELEALGRRLAEMGGVAEKMLADATDGLFAFDVDRARRAVASGLLLDTLRRGIEESAIVTIAREQPVSVDLRECIAAFRVASDLVADRRPRQRYRQPRGHNNRGGALVTCVHRSEIDA